MGVNLSVRSTIDFFTLKIGEERLDKWLLVWGLDITKLSIDIEDFGGFGKIKRGKLAPSVKAERYKGIVWNFA